MGVVEQVEQVDEREVLRAHNAAQKAEEEARRARVQTEILDPQRAYQEAQEEAAAADPAEASTREWEGGPSDVEELERLKALHDRAVRLLAGCDAERKLMQTKHQRENPTWPEEKLRDAAAEYAATLREVDRAWAIVYLGIARLTAMDERGLAAQVPPALVQRRAADRRYYDPAVCRALGLGSSRRAVWTDCPWGWRLLQEAPSADPRDLEQRPGG